MNNKRVCELVENKIRQIKELSNDINKDNKVIRKTSGKINKIKTSNNEDELEALVLLCRVVFSVVFITRNHEVTSSVYVRYYNRNRLPFQECVYMIYDETSKHYAPLYLFNEKDPDKLVKSFYRKNIIIEFLLRKFFKEQLHCKNKYRQLL
jgi:hypothetical protein